MSAESHSWNSRMAEAHLYAVSPQLAQVIAQVGPCRLGEAREKTDLFTALATAIVYQQPAGRVAEKIWTRFAALFGDAPLHPSGSRSWMTRRSGALGCRGRKLAACEVSRQNAWRGSRRWRR
jgi:3-methyladenine DNA glycosylase/8-oxoguanine DNA glycosylase